MRNDFRASIVKLVVLLVLAAPGTATAQRSAYRLRPLERVRNPLVGRADLGGRVFDDRDGNGRQDAGEPGLAGVVVSLDDGRYAVTAADGSYLLAEVLPGQRAVLLRPETLPTGGEAGSVRAIREVPPGAFVRVDFPATVQRETLRLGQAQETGWRAFPELAEAPVNVVGNATDLQALLNGRRLPFPEVNLELTGLQRGGYVSPDRWGPVSLRLNQRFEEPPEGWEVTLVGVDGTPLRTFEGKGAPPAVLPLDGRGPEGQPLEGPAALAARLCVRYGADTRACSPHRPLGLLGEGGVRPMLEIPQVAPEALVQGEAAALDPDGSFIFPARPGEDRRIAVSLTRADGRHTRTTAAMPHFTLLEPAAAIPVVWGTQTDRYRAPPEPGPITVEALAEVPAGAKVQLGQRPLEVAGGRVQVPLALPPGRSLHELTVTAPEGWNTIFELSFLLAERTPEGQLIITREKIPELELALPPADAPLTRDTLRVRGRAEPGATVTANGVALTTRGGDFEAEVPVPGGALTVQVSDAEGHRGELARTWKPRPAVNTGHLWVDAEPYLRLVHSEPALRGGFQGAGRIAGQRLSQGGLDAWAGASITSLDRRPSPPTEGGVPELTTAPSPWAAAALHAGAETFLGRTFVAGLRYEGALFVGPELPEQLPMRHDLTLAASLLGERFDVVADAGTGLDQGPEGPQVLLAGGGLGLRWRASPSVDVRARLGARVALDAPSQGETPELLDAAAQITWRSAAGPLLSLRLLHVEDSRALNPEAAGDVGHLAISAPLFGRLTLVESLGLWAVRGSVTGLNVTRLELPFSTELLFAVDYRLQTQLEVHAHTFRVEGDYFVTDWLRVGAFYQLHKITAGGSLDSRLQARAEVLF